MTIRRYHLTTLLCGCIFLVAGCSSSSSSDSTGSTSSTQSGVVNPTDTIDENTDDQIVGTVPVTQTTTRVSVDITVPVYVSNALQVQLVWGDTDRLATWVTDELWNVTADLPVDTENQMLVIFSDDNGGRTLGQADINFQTGTSATQTVEIASEQFNTSQWDDDADGVSNIDELLAGGDPAISDSDAQPVSAQPFQASFALIEDKTFRISWQVSEGASYYRVLEDPTGVAGYTPISDNLISSTRAFDHRVALFNRTGARYIVQACNESTCVDSDALIISGSLEDAIGEFTFTNDDGAFHHTYSVAISGDGTTFVASGSEGTQIYVRENDLWQLQSVLGNGDLALSADGNTLVISRPTEGCSQSYDVFDIDGNLIPDCNLASPRSGAVYVYTRTNGVWEQQAHLRARIGGYQYNFGRSVSLSADGNTLAVGQANSDNDAGSAYVYTRIDESWEEQAYLTASNADSEFGYSALDNYRPGDIFGSSVSLSGDGLTLAVGAPFEDSSATGINGDQSDNSVPRVGAVYVFGLNDETWQQQAYVKPSYSYEHSTSFGTSVALSATGDTLAVGAIGDDSIAIGFNGDQTYDNAGNNSGAVYVFERSDETWQEQAYVKASNNDALDQFGESVSLSADGDTLAIGSVWEDSYASGINGDQLDNSVESAGAVYVMSRTDGVWQQQAYLKSTDIAAQDYFGLHLSLSADGESLVVIGRDVVYLY